MHRCSGIAAAAASAVARAAAVPAALPFSPALLTLAQHTRGFTAPIRRRRHAAVCCAAAAAGLASCAAVRPMSTAAATPHSSGHSSGHSSQPRVPRDSPPLFSYSERDLDLTQPLPSLRYPVVLVHGYLGYASLIRAPFSGGPLFEYFGGVRAHLGEMSGGGITVLTPVNPPAASIAARAKKLQIALGLGAAGKQATEADVQGGEHTVRQAAPSADSAPPPSDPRSKFVEYQNTGGRFDSTRHKSDSAPLKQHQQEELSAPTAEQDASTNSVKTSVDVAEEKESAAESSAPAGASMILGGQQIDLASYRGKFHLIAHSMGGLDCRYLISQLQSDGASPMRNRIASLTTVATPHRGSPVADIVLDVIDLPFGPGSFSSNPTRFANAFTFNKFSQFAAGLFGIDVSGISNLTTHSMRDFNSRVRDHPDVRYHSYGGAKRFPFYSVWAAPSHWIRTYARRHDHRYDVDGICPGGENDGLVSVGSANWGHYCGTTTLDHLEQIGLGVWHKHLPLYRQIVFNLADIERQERETEQKEPR